MSTMESNLNTKIRKANEKEEGGCGDDQEGARKIEERLTERLMGINQHLQDHDKRVKSTP